MTDPFRNSNARYILPSENEWYKAAYYSSSGTYSNYLTGSDAVPTATLGGTVAGAAVYGQSFPGSPADVSNAGGLSPYGTMGQGGNVFEWMETELDGVNDSSGSSRGLRGGSWFNFEDFLRTSFLSNLGPTGESVVVGYRAASVPEPTGPVLTMLAGG